MSNHIQTFTSQIEDLLGKMLTPVQITVEDMDDSISVQIQDNEDTGLLIGKHGKTIESINIIANLMYKQTSGEWKRVIVNASDWNEKEQRRLESLAENVAQRAIDTGKPQFLYSLSPSQRRIIHTLLSENSSVQTRSEGDGSERYLIVEKTN